MSNETTPSPATILRRIVDLWENIPEDQTVPDELNDPELWQDADAALSSAPSASGDAHDEYARWLRSQAEREELHPAARAALDDVAVVAEANAERGEWSSSRPMAAPGDAAAPEPERVRAEIEKAREKVQPIIDKEREGERHPGDIRFASTPRPAAPLDVDALARTLVTKLRAEAWGPDEKWGLALNAGEALAFAKREIAAALSAPGREDDEDRTMFPSDEALLQEMSAEELRGCIREAEGENMRLAARADEAERENERLRKLLGYAREDVQEVADKQTKRHRIAGYKDFLGEIDAALQSGPAQEDNAGEKDAAQPQGGRDALSEDGAACYSDSPASRDGADLDSDSPALPAAEDVAKEFESIAMRFDWSTGLVPRKENVALIRARDDAVMEACARLVEEARSSVYLGAVMGPEFTTRDVLEKAAAAIRAQKGGGRG